ncbi:DUF1289 domain-containing protein [Shewanella intestini]|uniref:DUF1289 domain-containing protein n=1 Tax=Shewanella intestini TaxID=2017544 RepID=A0ABS5I0Q2_9GAMM|nr:MULTISPECIES: DUF1289 domain-containing protein [Shewanella]MBR9726890.1 DUF1289 domain-containing protein [Shewanella intestini]MRG34544.1 DUF1289 domain-containing protein [Shewanella sp. XMDDZSB0408]
MQSPCVARCGLNDDDYCMGCYRHIDEIVAWSKANEQQQQQIVAALPARKSQFEGDSNTQILSRDKWLAAQAKITRSV